jgi:hypothetical protein
MRQVQYNLSDITKFVNQNINLLAGTGVMAAITLGFPSFVPGFVGSVGTTFFGVGTILLFITLIHELVLFQMSQPLKMLLLVSICVGTFMLFLSIDLSMEFKPLGFAFYEHLGWWTFIAGTVLWMNTKDYFLRGQFLPYIFLPYTLLLFIILPIGLPIFIHHQYNAQIEKYVDTYYYPDRRSL